MFHQSFPFNRFSDKAANIISNSCIWEEHSRSLIIDLKSGNRTDLNMIIYFFNFATSICGITISRISRSYKSALKFLRAIRGSLNVATHSNPLSASAFFKDNVISGSSSINVLLLFFLANSSSPIGE